MPSADRQSKRGVEGGITGGPSFAELFGDTRVASCSRRKPSALVRTLRRVSLFIGRGACAPAFVGPFRCACDECDVEAELPGHRQ